MDKAPKQHVIFLGAGASSSSGYPIGNMLRQRLCCRKQFRAGLEKAFGKNAYGINEICNNYFERFGTSIDLFRNGGFATVDEFSRLLSRTHPKQVQDMKKLMRLALLFHNPEDKFQDSDYYPFIQRLFCEDDLSKLKDNITVISYNYDCYLDFLLLRAFEHRQQIREGLSVEDPYYKNKLTSGFYDPEKTDWAQTQSFNYYKLHGSILYQGKQDASLHHAFFAEPLERLRRLNDEYYRTSVPPVVFPWELFNSDGEFVDEESFIFVTEGKNKDQKRQGRTLFKLYKAIWESALQKIRRAEKISFVGLSMHPFLHDGFKYLFRGKERGVRMVVANPDNYPFRNAKNHPMSPCGRVAAMLKKAAPNLKFLKSSSEDDGILSGDALDSVELGMTPRYSFAEFIQKEID